MAGEQEPIPLEGRRTAEDLTLAALHRALPFVPWREPIGVTYPDGIMRYACRICLGRHGLRGSEVPHLPQSRAEVVRHIEQEHPGGSATQA